MIAADVYAGGELAGHFFKRDDGLVEFAYAESANSPVATTLPVEGGRYVAVGGALPPFFANLLPEGRRLSTLKRQVKASLDDELALLLAVGKDTIGDISVVPHGEAPSFSRASIDLDAEPDFTAVLTDAGIADPIAVPGVQDKASVRTIAPVGAQGRDYILRPLSTPNSSRTRKRASTSQSLRDIRSPRRNCFTTPTAAPAS